jgi:hypothetical protein
MRALILFISIFIVSGQGIYSQWVIKYNSVPMYSGVVSGWMNFKKTQDVWENRLYFLDATSFNIMSANFSNEVEFTYTFTPEEIAAGYLIYSLRVDVTGDEIIDFYVMAAHGMASNYRKSFKIINIITGATIFERNDPAYSYSIPSVWDIDNDGILECSVAKSDYPAGTYTYQEVYNTGGFSVASVSDEMEPAAFLLKQNYPNPFNPLTTIEFNINTPSEVNLQIYDLQGGLVKTLIKRYMEIGSHRIIWDGTNETGAKAASGVYVYSLNTGEISDNKKMIVLK